MRTTFQSVREAFGYDVEQASDEDLLDVVFDIMKGMNERIKELERSQSYHEEIERNEQNYREALEQTDRDRS